MSGDPKPIPQWPRPILLLALLGGNVALALGPLFVRLADGGPVSAGFWRLFLALPFLMLFARLDGQPVTGLRRGTIIALCAAGAVFAFDLASWHVGIEMTSAANATLFGNSGSLVLMVWGFVILRRLPHGREWLAIVSALVGAAILLGRSMEVSMQTLVGDLFCLLAGLFYAAYLLILQDARRGLGNWSLLVWVGLAGAPVMLGLALLAGEPVWPSDWTPLVALFISSQLVGQGLLVFSLGHFPPLVIGLALLCQPAVAAIYGWFLFSEAVGWPDVVGMAMLGAALVLSRAVRPASAPSVPKN